MLIVKNPSDYLSRQANVIKRKGMEWNFKYYGSPISISANGLKCNLDELKVILENKLFQFRNETQNDLG
jgi:hypothetical protein